MNSLPFVTVKFAMSLDGRIATKTGDSQWISSGESLTLAHRLRSEHQAILVGIQTVLTDNPRLTVRHVDGRDPLRVVVDSRLRIPDEANVLADGAANHTLIATTEAADPQRLAHIRGLGADVILLPTAAETPNVSLEALLVELRRRSLASVLVEGGAKIVTSLLAARLINRLVIAIAPKLIGRGIEAVGDLGITRLRDAITFASVETYNLGSDIIFDGRLR